MLLDIFLLALVLVTIPIWLPILLVLAGTVFFLPPLVALIAFALGYPEIGVLASATTVVVWAWASGKFD